MPHAISRERDPRAPTLLSELATPLSAERALVIGVGLARAVARGRGGLPTTLHPGAILLEGEAVRVTTAGPPAALDRLRYRAPELARGDEAVADEIAYLWSIGVILYELVTGRAPFTALDAPGWARAHLASRPPAPRDLVPLPASLSDVIMRLLAPVPSERYRSANGLLHDLVAVVAHPEEPLELGREDRRGYGDRPALRGRDIEMAQLRALVLAGSGVALVHGPPGIGKSTLIDATSALGGLSGRGGGDSARRDEPLWVARRVLEDLATRTLAWEPPAIEALGRALSSALGEDARLLAALAPTLRLLGIARPAGDVPATAPHLQSRLMIRAFEVFAAHAVGGPLILCIDDLQWVDAASRELVSDLARGRRPRIVVLAACRDDAPYTLEVAGERVVDLKLGPLDERAIEGLLGDALVGPIDDAPGLASLVRGRTSGNPFQALQVVQTEVTLGRITFDGGAWQWQLSRFGDGQEGVGQNLHARLSALPPTTLTLLHIAAHAGRAVDVGLLARAAAIPVGEVVAHLLPARSDGLVVGRDGDLRFTHERVREVTSALVPAEDLPRLRLAIARAQLIEYDARDAFAAAERLSGVRPWLDGAERAKAARVFLDAARAAHLTSAFDVGQTFAARGLELLDAGGDDALGFELGLLVAACAWQCGDLAAATRMFVELLARFPARRHQMLVHREAIAAAMRHANARLGLDAMEAALRTFGREVPRLHEPEVAHRLALAARPRIAHRLALRAPETLADLPPIADGELRMMLESLATVAPLVLGVSITLHGFIASELLELTLMHGACAALPHALVHYAAYLVHAGRDRWDDADRLSRAARASLMRPEHAAARPIVLNMCSLVEGVSSHPREIAEIIKAGRTAADDVGDITFGALHLVQLGMTELGTGRALDALCDDLIARARSLRGLGFHYAMDPHLAVLDAVATLIGEPERAERVAGPDTDPAARSERVARDGLQWPTFVTSASRVLASVGSDPARVWADVEVMRRHRGVALLCPALLFGVLHGGIVAAAALEAGVASEADALTTLDDAIALFADLALHRPALHGGRHALLMAERARLRGAPVEAIVSFELAIERSRAARFLHDEALAHELVARVLTGLGAASAARTHLIEAHRAYVVWGADAEARRIERAHGGSMRLARPARLPAGDATRDPRVLARATRAITSERTVAAQVELLSRFAADIAGVRACEVILVRNDELEVETATRERPPNQGILRYAWRTAAPVVVDDMARDRRFADAAWRDERGRSVLCVPIVRANHVSGFIYLTDGAPGAFDAACLDRVCQLASRAAVAMENAHLFGELAGVAAELRRSAVAISRIVDVERRTVAHDLHDSIGQMLPALRHRLEREPTAVADVARALGEMQRQVRTLTFELHPSMLDEVGLVPALSHFAQALAGEGLTVELVERGQPRPLEPAVASFLFRSTREILRNVVRHARARTARMALEWGADVVCVRVGDDGVGFDPDDVLGRGGRRGVGLTAVRERAALMGGSMRLASGPEGSRVELLVPLGHARASASQTTVAVGTTPGARGPASVMPPEGPRSARSRAHGPTLHGRELELERLRALVESGSGAAIVHGPSGIGKSSLIDAVTPLGGMIARGAGDPLRGLEPLLLARQVLEDLAGHALTWESERLQRLQRSLGVVLGSDAPLALAFAPTLGFHVAPVGAAELTTSTPRRRLPGIVRRTLDVFAAHAGAGPLIVCLDDLQWADAASQELVRELIASPSAGLVLLAAHRDGVAAPLDPGGAALDVALGPLDEAALGALLAETLAGPIDDPAGLARLVARRGSGNPLHVIEIVRREIARARIAFDGSLWRWRLADLGEAEDELATLLRERLLALPAESLALARVAACVGLEIDPALLAAVCGLPVETTIARLAPLVADGLVIEGDRGARFAHERAREAASTFVDEHESRSIELAIVRVQLSDHHPRDALTLAARLGRVVALLPREDHHAAARVALAAARSAHLRSAFAIGSDHAALGLALAPEGDDAIRFDLALCAAACAWPRGAMDEAAGWFEYLLTRSLERDRQVLVYREATAAAIRRADPIGGLAAARAALRLFDRDLPPLAGLDPDPARALAERRARIMARLASTPPEAFVDLAPIREPAMRLLLDVLASIIPLTYEVHATLHGIIACEMMELTLEHGAGPATPLALAHFASHIAWWDHARWADADRLGAAARALASRPEHADAAPHTLYVCSLVDGLSYPPAHVIALARDGIRAATAVVDQTFGALHLVQLGLVELGAGRPLRDLAKDLEARIRELRGLGFSYALDAHMALIDAVTSLACEPPRARDATDPELDPAERAERVTRERLAWPSYVAAATRLLARGLGADPSRAWTDVKAMRPYRAVVRVSPTTLFGELLAGITAASALTAGVAPAAEARAVIDGAEALFASLARHRPDLFGGKHALVVAERARLNGDAHLALVSYERAILASRQLGLVLDEALAHELAAAQLARLGATIAARAHLAEAMHAYGIWGAWAEVRRLARRHGLPLASVDPTLAGVADPDAGRDALTRATQAIASELGHDRLVALITRVAVEVTGATRGALVLVSGRALVVASGPDAHRPNEAILRYAWRTAAPVLVDDTTRDRRFVDDAATAGSPRALACVPMLLRDEVGGFIYLERDDVGERGFARASLELLDEVAQQAAIALENARLFDELERHAADLRRSATQLASVADAERRALARELDGSIGQALPDLAARLTREPQSAPEVARTLGALHRRLRALGFEMYPIMLDDLGLAPALEHYTTTLVDAGVAFEVFEHGVARALDSGLAAFLFRATQELVRNVVRHARATEAFVAVEWRQGAVRVSVSDNGVGFRDGDAHRERAPRGLGLFDLRERSAHLGGSLTVTSSRHGSVVVLDVPYETGP